MRSVGLVLLLGTCFSLSGCYYGQLASGQLKILWERQPLDEAKIDPAHPEEVRQLLGLVESVREYASDLGLRVQGQYTSYVNWPGDRIVTTLVRTRVGELEPVPWWFPLVGRLPYKGYFDQARAEAEAERIRADGEYDLCVSGVTAYSTLGWLDDPVTRPMLTRGPASLVETLFHELVHATAFLPGDADFNEGVAQFIGQQAAVAFFSETEPPGGFVSLAAVPSETSLAPSPASWPAPERVRASIRDRVLIAEATLAFRDRLDAFHGLSDRAKRRAEAEAGARSELAALPLEVYDANRVGERARLSDACLALRGTYVRDSPRHAAVLDALGGDLTAMIERLGVWADESRESAEFFEIAAPQSLPEPESASESSQETLP